MFNRRDFLKGLTVAAGTAAAGGGLSRHGQTVGLSANMSGFRAAKIPTVRIGFVGLGMRGSGAVQRMMHIEGVEITCKRCWLIAGSRSQMFIQAVKMPGKRCVREMILT